MDPQHDFISLIRNHQALLNKVVFLYADDHEERNDLRQEIVSQAWGSFKSFKGESRFSTWLYRVAMNVAIATVRKKIKKKDLSYFPAEKITNPHDTEVELLELILRILNPIEKSIVLLLIEGFDQAEIAGIVGISEVNTRTKIHRIRKKLKENGIDKLA